MLAQMPPPALVAETCFTTEKVQPRTCPGLAVVAFEEIELTEESAQAFEPGAFRFSTDWVPEDMPEGDPARFRRK